MLFWNLALPFQPTKKIMKNKILKNQVEMTPGANLAVKNFTLRNPSNEEMKELLVENIFECRDKLERMRFLHQYGLWQSSSYEEFRNADKLIELANSSDIDEWTIAKQTITLNDICLAFRQTRELIEKLKEAIRQDLGPLGNIIAWEDNQFMERYHD